ncbi:unnamed protein product [Adineta steineri]|uniref:Uncharacterized protein n=1 Tax=Adineta steineri TaxID=433720 RepID=A0A814XTU8_9BILA|nr:unnamed protein product [Adineta steineri]CAF1220387.1 unnamed protein product [Adineta steineri]CAF1260073.1 unnamed protein product [Adineta steineri]CAF3517131.1 unnamed protein product [Adineta steineri]CAF3757647.1 unnamed protein product [Adineta steineri]
MIIALIVISIILLISGLFITIYLVYYSCLLKNFSKNNLIKSQQYPSTQMQMISCSTSIPNISQSGNEITIEEIEPSISDSKIISLEERNSVPNKFFQQTDPHDDKVNFLQLGEIIIDRPLGIALQPFDSMGPVLMKFNVSEQHWIRHNNE